MGKLRSVVCAMLIVVATVATQAQLVAQGPVNDRAAQALERKARRITNADRMEAAARARSAQASSARHAGGIMATTSAGMTPMLAPPQGGTPNYFGPEPNWAYSPAPTVVGGVISGGIRKFVDPLPGLYISGVSPAPAAGQQYIPVAVPDTTTYSGCDYYEIELGEYTEKLHSDLLPTTLRGYRQTNTTDANVSKFNYLGPLIIATKNKPVRIKFTNKLPTGAGGNLFLPVDTTEMGAGMGPLGMNTHAGWPMNYTQNRGTLHLHGGATPWISDGTPHQWITPAGELTDYPKGVSVSNVPDMPDPGPGSQTFFYSNQQSARLMFYHDHAYGITRLNVYAGEAAGYLLTDAVEQDLITRAILPDAGTPLIIQDRTFVNPTTVLATDPTWPFPVDATKSNLWYPHVYMPNQNPNDINGVNQFGRWDYGPWFWPPWPTSVAPITNPDGTVKPALPDLSMTMEAFHDTALVNGAVYPYMAVQPKAYRFRILNAANDRMWNLQLYQASSIVGGIALTSGGSGYTANPLVTITPAAGDTTGHGATALATVDLTAGSPTLGQVVSLTLNTVGSAYTLAPTVTIAPPTSGVAATATASVYTGSTEVGMVPAVIGSANFPAAWTAQTLGQPGDILDGRTGGVPDPATIGPSIVQIGTEGGFLPTPVTWTNVPLGYDRDPKSITIGNVKEHNLFMGPAERADVIIDFSAFAGKTILLYNDSIAAVPAADSRLDYYTGDMDQTATGGTTTTLPGYGPNTRTLMQFRVAAAAPAPYNFTALNNEFISTPTTQSVFQRGQDPIIVPQGPYNAAYNATFPTGTTAYARISSTSLTFTPIGAAAPVTIPFQPKAIQELFENTYGRMSAYLGVELPFTNGTNQTTIQYGYIDPATEVINDTTNPAGTPIGTLSDGTQIWKITHNGVDTHPIHFHLFNVQLINRVGWDGVVKPPEANELGWRETIRMNPLEDCIVALRAVSAKTPFGVPDSIRPLDPTMPVGPGVPGQFRNINPADGTPITVNNDLTNFGWEYVWHCHILSHEEMDMMRPIIFNVARTLPTAPILNAVTAGALVNLTWTDATSPIPGYGLAGTNWGNPANEVGFRIERAVVTGGTPGAYSAIGTALANTTTYSDSGAAGGTTYSYRVVAFNAAGDSTSNATSVVGGATPPTAPTNLTAALQAGPQVLLTWTDNATTETGFVLERSVNGGAFTQIAAPGPKAGTGSMTYTDTTVTVGNTYVYRVKAMNNGAASAYATSGSVAVILPAAPTALSGVVQAGPQVALTWTDNATNESGFALERSDNGGAFAQIATPAAKTGTGAVNYTDTTVVAGNSYVYRVKATSAGLSSAYATSASIAVPLPVAPTTLAGVLAQLQVTLTWNDNNTLESGFVVERAIGTGAYSTLTTLAAHSGTGSMSYVDSTVTSNSYSYRVKAMSGAVSSAYTNVVAITVPPPAAPTAITVALQTGPAIAVTFTDNATSETGFALERGVGGVYTQIATLPVHNATGSVTYTDATVTIGTAYTYRVKAVSGAVSSAYATSASITVPPPPAAPTTFSASASGTGAGNNRVVNLRWKDNATNESGYTVQRATDLNFTVGLATFTLPANTAAYKDSGLAGKTTYYYRVQAFNVSGASAWASLKITTP